MKGLSSILVATALTFGSWDIVAATDVHVLGQMRRMFTVHDIGANVELSQVNLEPHVYGLGPVAGLKGEITVVDGTVFVSSVSGDKPRVAVAPDAKAVFLVYASIPKWHSTDLPENVQTEKELASYLEGRMPTNTRSAFLVQGTALKAQYHIQNYKGSAKDLTHEAHDRAKAFFAITNVPVELVGFFTNVEGDGGSFVHMGQTTHMHIISADRKQTGHLESIQMAPGAKLLLPEGSK